MLTTTGMTPQRRADVHEALRSATHAAHVRLNHHPLLSGLTRPGYPLETYRTVLQVYARAYAALEGQLLAWLAHHPQLFDYQSRRKLGWLLQDLAWLGAMPPPAQGEAEACPTVQGLGQLLGVLYPLEGATLGGQVISAHLARHLGLGPETGGRFFCGYGAASEQHWRQFLDFLGAQQLEAGELELARQSACATFAYLERLLDAAVPVAAATLQP